MWKVQTKSLFSSSKNLCLLTLIRFKFSFFYGNYIKKVVLMLIMKLNRDIILLFYCLCFLGCQVDSGSKKHPHPQKKIINKSTAVTSSYNPSVDILFIIDNSGTMANFQDFLTKNSDLFISQFLDTKFIDYHIAVTTSSYGPPVYLNNGFAPPSGSETGYVTDGNLTRCNNLSEKTGYPYTNYVDKNTPKGDQCLREMMKVGTHSQTDEHFFNIIILSLSELISGENTHFYRPDAHLAVFIITDSYDQSSVTYRRAYEFLLDLKEGDKRKIHYAAGIATLEMPEHGCSPEEKAPADFIKMAKLFEDRGRIFNLCQFDYGKDLALFASHLVNSTLAIPLDFIPDLDTIEVRYVHEEGEQSIPRSPNGWTYDIKNNLVRLSGNLQLPDREGKFNLKYEPLYTPKK